MTGADSPPDHTRPGRTRRRLLATSLALTAVTAGAVSAAAPGFASHESTDRTATANARFVPRIQPAPKVAKGKAFTSRTAVGSKVKVSVGRTTWGADHISSGGHAVTLAKPRKGSMAKLLTHARAGASKCTVKVPGDGVYRVSLLLPQVKKDSAATRIVSGKTPLVSGLKASSKSAQSVSFTVGVKGKSLVIAFNGPRLEVSALQVVRVSGLPSDGALVPVRPVVTKASGTATSLPTAVPAGTEWPSGAWPGGQSLPQDVTAFSDFRHRALDVISTSVPGTSWKSMATDFYGVDRYAGEPARLAIAYPMLPYDKSGNLPDAAAGKYDSYLTAFAQGLVQRGRGDSIVRLGWEFNGDWQPWAAFNPQQYIAAFRHEVQVLRAADPSIVINWNGNYGPSQVQLDPLTQLYPGDDVVDEIGLDAYDRKYYHVTNAATWKSYTDNPDGGLNAWYSFAMAHHKLFSVPEWALYDENGASSDNPYYIAQMYSWFAAHAKGLAFEAYFNEDAPYIGAQLFSLTGKAENPLAGAIYSELWG